MSARSAHIKENATRSFTQETWLAPPHNRESFQYTQSLFPTARLRRGDAPPSPLPYAPEDLGEIQVTGIDGKTLPLQAMLDATFTDAFLVCRDNTLIHEQYFNGMQADSLHLLNSISKTFLGMLAGSLVADGALDPNERVIAYAPYLAGSAFEKTTVAHVLDMTAAVKFDEDYAVLDDDFWIETAVLGWRPDLRDRAQTNALKTFAAARTATEQVDGEGFHYRTLLTNVVAMVLEGAAQLPVQTLMEQRLWQRLRPEQDGNVILDATGFPYFGAGMSVTARDLTRFGQLLLNDGKVGEVQVIPAEWIASTRSGSEERRAHFAATEYASTLPNWHYQNQTWACGPEGLLVCIGIYGQTVYVHKPSGLVITKLSTHPEPANDLLYANTFSMMSTLVEALAG